MCVISRWNKTDALCRSTISVTELVRQFLDLVWVKPDLIVEDVVVTCFVGADESSMGVQEEVVLVRVSDAFEISRKGIPVSTTVPANRFPFLSTPVLFSLGKNRT